MVHGISGNWGKRVQLALLAGSAAATWPGVAAAQEAEPDESIVVTGERALSGTKTDTPVTEIPQSISVISAQDFQDRAAVNLQDVIRYSAGAASELQGVDTRGDFLAVRGTGAEQYLDGLNRMPGFIYGGRIEIFTVERAELLRGPSSTLYGGGGAGGILNSISKRPQETFGGEVGAIYGTDSYKQLQLDVTGPLADGVSARLVGVYRDAELQQRGHIFVIARLGGFRNRSLCNLEFDFIDVVAVCQGVKGSTYGSDQIKNVRGLRRVFESCPRGPGQEEELRLTADCLEVFRRKLVDRLLRSYAGDTDLAGHQRTAMEMLRIF